MLTAFAAVAGSRKAEMATSTSDDSAVVTQNETTAEAGVILAVGSQALQSVLPPA